jgi:hypothetical protein
MGSLGQGILFFIAGALVAGVGMLLTFLVRSWLSRRDDGWERPRRGGEGAPVREPTLAELLAETGWRINPDEQSRELARTLVPLGIIGLFALLFLVAHSRTGWFLLGIVVGWPICRGLLAAVQARRS